MTRLVPTGGDDGGSGGVGWAGMSFEPDGDSGMVRERERERWCGGSGCPFRYKF